MCFLLDWKGICECSTEVAGLLTLACLIAVFNEQISKDISKLVSFMSSLGAWVSVFALILFCATGCEIIGQVGFVALCITFGILLCTFIIKTPSRIVKIRQKKGEIKRILLPEQFKKL